MQAFTFPNCLGNLTLTVSGPGAPFPTGNVSLIVAGGHKNATLGSVRASGLQCLLVHATHVFCHLRLPESVSALKDRCMPQTTGPPATSTLLRGAG